jgi:hypothetical protein
MRGRAAIAEFLAALCSSTVDLKLSHAVVADERAAFRVTCTFPDGSSVLEQVIVELRDGLIALQVDVEAWDPL